MRALIAAVAVAHFAAAAVDIKTVKHSSTANIVPGVRVIRPFLIYSLT
jgi:hypothetical protein